MTRTAAPWHRRVRTFRTDGTSAGTFGLRLASAIIGSGALLLLGGTVVWVVASPDSAQRHMWVATVAAFVLLVLEVTLVAYPRLQAPRS